MVYRLHSLRSEEAREWLLVSKSARDSKNFSMASDAVLHATALGESSALIHHAKLLFADRQVRVCAAVCAFAS